jgi:nucleoside-triphosphatase
MVPTSSEPHPPPTHILLLTGAPGIGKTTIIKKVAERFKGKRLSGFYTEEIREHGERRGFRLVIFDGQERVIAHVDFPRAHCVGKYGVDVAALDEVVAPLWCSTMQWRSIWSTR